MKSYIKILVAALFAMGVAACSSGDGGGGEALPQVTFTTEILSRAALTDVKSTFANGDRMSVYRTKNNAISGETPTVHSASCNNGSWTPTPAIELKKEEKFYIFAIYPFDANASDPTAYPISVAAQADYMYSSTGVAASYEAPAIVLRMRHAMAILAFNIRSYVGGALTAIAVNDPAFPTEGTLRVTGSTTPTKFGAYTKTMNVATSEAGWTTDHPGMFIIPHQSASAGLTVKLTIGGKEYPVTLPAANFTAGKKYVASLMLTEQGLTMESNTLQIISLDEPTPEVAAPSYGMVSITHHAAAIKSPTFTGATAPYGFVYWGDSTNDPYSAEAAHSYLSAGQFVMKVDIWNAEEVAVSDLSGIEQIDLSKF